MAGIARERHKAVLADAHSQTRSTPRPRAPPLNKSASGPSRVCQVGTRAQAKQRHVTLPFMPISLQIAGRLEYARAHRPKEGPQVRCPYATMPLELTLQIPNPGAVSAASPRNASAISSGARHLSPLLKEGSGAGARVDHEIGHHTSPPGGNIGGEGQSIQVRDFRRPYQPQDITHPCLLAATHKWFETQDAKPHRTSRMKKTGGTDETWFWPGVKVGRRRSDRCRFEKVHIGFRTRDVLVALFPPGEASATICLVGLCGLGSGREGGHPPCNELWKGDTTTPLLFCEGCVLDCPLSIKTSLLDNRDTSPTQGQVEPCGCGFGPV